MKISRGIGVLPNLITIGNGICGFAAVVKLMKIRIVTDPATGELVFNDVRLFTVAAWLVLLGMVFDVFDGRVARLSGTTSNIGAQLDSLCDLVTFGVAPALMVVRLNMINPQAWQSFVWFFCLAYFLGAMLRLARFNDENDPDESSHLCFKGLPSPAAAGCISALVLFYTYIAAFEQRELKLFSLFVEPETVQAVQAIVGWIPVIMPVLAIALGWTMVTTRLEYDHVASQFFHKSHSFEFIVYIVFGGLLIAILPELLLVVIFIGYLVYTPCQYLWCWVTGARGEDSETLPTVMTNDQ